MGRKEKIYNGKEWESKIIRLSENCKGNYRDENVKKKWLGARGKR